ncbi:MAG: L-seryl-tRNA(Sec) selenium transferase [Planctomycetota bacterium]
MTGDPVTSGVGSEGSAQLRSLPSVERLLGAASFEGLIAAHGRAPVTEAVRADLDALRAEVRAGRPLPETGDAACAARVGAALSQAAAPRYPRALNATGVVLHTGLGRAPLAPEAVEALRAVAGAVVLEVEQDSGQRGQRDAGITALVRELTGAEAACVVNNNAGATLIALAALAAGRPVIVSRGQLVEIGGSYRIPDVMAQSGARMVEVGTTNRTHLADYERALDAHPDAGLLLRVHTSNFRVQGFTKEVPLGELVALGRARGVPVMDDLGSGCLIDLAPYGLPAEPLVQHSLSVGAGVATFSGDKLLGGPQAGIVVGERELVGRIREHPLYRALRPGKLTLAALEATLRLYRDPARALERLPVARRIATPLVELRRRADALAAAIEQACPGLAVEVVAGTSKVGGGSYAVEELATWVVAVASPERGADALVRALRLGEPAVFARIALGRVCFDPRTLDPGEEAELVRALVAALA